MNRQLIFVHGWGFDASIWREVMAQFSQDRCTALELGFMGKRASNPLEIAEQTVIVGHSLGVLWALKHLPKSPLGLISICGFDRFSPPVPRKNLVLMKRGIKQNPAAQLAHFWRSCGISPFKAGESLNQQALSDGLDQLMSDDARRELTDLACPLHILAARNDQVVPEVMSNAIWGDRHIHWSNEGGHALPLTRPGWCAEQINNFLDEHCVSHEQNG